MSYLALCHLTVLIRFLAERESALLSRWLLQRVAIDYIFSLLRLQRCTHHHASCK